MQSEVKQGRRLFHLYPCSYPAPLVEGGLKCNGESFCIVVFEFEIEKENKLYKEL